ncbi:MAG TPA: hypothetical protein VHR45_14475 [Thermoanaerobaculia bacterium]|nr:hypothetical protein [Thermoanaerobaculia bacterium]
MRALRSNHIHREEPRDAQENRPDHMIYVRQAEQRKFKRDIADFIRGR